MNNKETVYKVGYPVPEPGKVKANTLPYLRDGQPSWNGRIVLSRFLGQDQPVYSWTSTMRKGGRYRATDLGSMTVGNPTGGTDASQQSCPYGDKVLTSWACCDTQRKDNLCTPELEAVLLAHLPEDNK